MKPLEVKVESAQVVLFANYINLNDKLKIAELFNKQFGKVFDGSPTILPIPDDAPQEIPRVILNTKNGVFTCNIAINRVDLIYKSQIIDEYDSFGKFLKDFSILIDKLIQGTFLLIEGNLNRVGLIINYAADPKTNTIDFLRSNFLKRSNKEEKDIQVHKRYEAKLVNLKINNWLRIISRKPELKKSPLLIISDINTSRKEKYVIQSKDAQTFFKEALRISYETLSKDLND